MLTARQAAIRDFIAASVAERGVPPSLREMAVQFRITNEGVRGHLRALQRKGVIARQPYLARAIRVIDKLQSSKASESLIEF